MPYGTAQCNLKAIASHVQFCYQPGIAALNLLAQLKTQLAVCHKSQS